MFSLIDWIDGSEREMGPTENLRPCKRQVDIETLVHLTAKSVQHILTGHFPYAFCLWDILSTLIVQYMHTPGIFYYITETQRESVYMQLLSSV